MERVIVDCACGARLDASRVEPGKKVRCPKCGATLEVPVRGEESPVLGAEAPGSESPAVAEPRRSAHRAPRAPVPARKLPVVPIALAAAALAAVGTFLAAGGGGSAAAGKAPAGEIAAGAGGGGGPTGAAPAPPPALQPKPPEDPEAAKREEFFKRSEAAREAKDVPALVAAAKFGEEAGLSKEALDAYRSVLGLDRDEPSARAALGYTKYEGPAEAYRGKWLTAVELAKAGEAEAAIREEAERWTKDEFMRNAARMKGTMEKLAEPVRFQFYVDTKSLPRPYLIAAQEAEIPPPAEVARQVGPVFEALYEQFYREYGDACGIRPLEVPVPVWIFSSAEDYEKVHKNQPSLAPMSSKHVAGYYLGAFAVLVPSEAGTDYRSSGYLYLWNTDQLDAVAFHEGIHQLMDFNGEGRGFGAGQSPWFQEGLAEYWGGHEKKWDEGTKRFRYEIGRINVGRWKAARDAFQVEAPEEERLSLRRLVELSYLEFLGIRQGAQAEKPDPEDARTLGLVYAEGWALCNFLNKGLDGRYRQGFLRYLKSELEGEGGPEAFAACFDLKSEEDWSRLEEEWKTHVLETLRKEALEKDRRRPG